MKREELKKKKFFLKIKVLKLHLGQVQCSKGPVP